MTKNNKFGGSLIIILIYCIIGAICWPYTINSWLNYFGKPDAIYWWMGAIMIFVPSINKLAVPLAIITWIIFLFM